jgi:hypothetical protein
VGATFAARAVQACRRHDPDHAEGIIAYVTSGLSNGRTEGLNGKTRVITRRAYGFHSAHGLIALIKLCCSGIYLEPVHFLPGSTHYTSWRTPNATASSNVLLQQIQQPWSSDELAQVATELSQLKRTLANQLATSGSDADMEDADVDDAIEIGHVASAEKAARKGDQAGVVDALKLLGRKTWGLVEQLGLAYLKMRASEYLGLPSGDDKPSVFS